jgi:hypothetical protein
MKRYLVDTTLLTAGLLNRPAAVHLLTPWITRREAATSILVYGEVVEYIRRFPDYPRRYAELRELLREILPCFLTYRIVERYAELHRHMRPPHGPGLIGDIDTLPRVAPPPAAAPGTPRTRRSFEQALRPVRSFYCRA